MGYQDVSSKDTVWLRETWKNDNRAISHSASCARAERHEARKAKGEEVLMHASIWSSAFPDATSRGAWPLEASTRPDETAGSDAEGVSGNYVREESGAWPIEVPTRPGETTLPDAEGASGNDIGEENGDSTVGKTLVLLKPFCGMPKGTKAKVIGAKATHSGRQRLLLGPVWAGQSLGRLNKHLFSDKLGKLFEFAEAEFEEEDPEAELEEEEHETPPWVQRGIAVLWQHGGGNMNYTNFYNLVGQHKLTRFTKQDVFARPEFEWCGKGNKSIRLAGRLRFQRYN